LPLGAACQIERVKIKDGLAGLKDIRDNVKDATLRIDDTCAEDTNLIADVAILSKQ
jgi:hypothetical protein